MTNKSGEVSKPCLAGLTEEHLFILNVCALPPSSIKEFARIIGTAVINIAAERVDDLKSMISCPIPIDCFDEDSWRLEKIFGSVRISRKTIEIIWALSYGYSVFFMEVVDKGRIQYGQNNKYTDDPIVRPALAFIRWAMDEFEKGSTDPSILPTEFVSPIGDTSVPAPIPNIDALLESHQGVTNRVYQAVMAFFLHHELVHIFYPNTAGGGTPESEIEADRLAAQWILQSPPNDAERTYRLIGITIAETILAAKDLHQGLRQSKTHPPGFDRLRIIIAPYAPDECDPIWEIVGIILSIHMSSAEIGQDLITKIDVECFGKAIEPILEIIESHYSNATGSVFTEHGEEDMLE